MFFDYQESGHHDKFSAYEFDNPMSSAHSVTVRPTDRELDLIAMDIKELFQEKILWEHLPIIVKLALPDIEKNFPHITTESKRDSATHILFYVFENADSSTLPDTFYNPLFKNLAPHFVNIIITDSLDEYLTSVKIDGNPTDELIKEYANDILETFEDGFEWKDLATITKLGIRFTNQFEGLHYAEKKVIAKKFINYVIDNTDAKKLPEYYVDSVFKTISGETVEIIMNQLLIRY